MKSTFQKPDQWVSVIDCHDCKKQIPINESFNVSKDYEYFGVKGEMIVCVCKECHREGQLNKLI
jgi:hypothetical protein